MTENSKKYGSAMENQGILYWITGLPGAGKTTIGTELYYTLKGKRDNIVLLDGDVLLSILDENGFSEDERHLRAWKYARLCRTLTNQGITVICCTLSLFEDVRDWNRENNKSYVEIYIDVSDEILKVRNYKNMYSGFEKGKMNYIPGKDLIIQKPKNPDLVLINDGKRKIRDMVNEILDFNVKLSTNFDRDTLYWNDFYKKTKNLEEPSLFAQKVSKRMKKGKSILELGCGNGRDSLYFMKQGMFVTAIDASDLIIKQLSEQYIDMPIKFICDDFVCSEVVYKCQYDYCYSRFSIHAINERQEEELIKNVYNSLKVNGKFFVEVRSVNDDIYGKGKPVGRNAYFYNGHFRRFIVKEEFENLLIKTGFKVEYSEEKTGFAPMGKSDPPIIRIIAAK